MTQETESFLAQKTTANGDLQLQDVNSHANGHTPGQAPTIDFEAVLRALGPKVRFQTKQCLLLSACFITSSFITMNFVFIGLEPPFTCSTVNESQLFEYLSHGHNGTDTKTHQTQYDRCDIRVTPSNTSKVDGEGGDVITFGCLHGYRYQGGDHVSILTEWDLVCGQRGTAELSQTVMSLGWFIGSFLHSVLSDSFGRKKTIIFATLFSGMCEIGCAFAPSIYVIICLRFFSGFFASGVSSNSFVLAAEMLVTKHRVRYGVFVAFLWSTWSLLLCGIAYAFRANSWRDLQLCIALCGMTPLISIHFVEESASWLYGKGKYKQATKVLQKACRINGGNYEEVEPVWNELCAKGKNQETMNTKSTKDYNIFDLFRNNKLRASLLIAWLGAFANDVAYFGMYLSASTLVGNLYVNTGIMALLEFPGTICMLLMLKYRGRRFVIISFMTMAAICLLVSTCLSSIVVNYTRHIANTSTAFFLLGRLAISNSYSTIYIYIPELFPTTLRSSGMLLSMSGSCVGSMISPYLLPLYDMVKWLPGTCLIGVLAISSLFLLKLPETKGKQLATTLEEMSPQAV